MLENLPIVRIPKIKLKITAKDSHVSKRMKANRARNTVPELLLRKLLRGSRMFGYRLHYKEVIGKPDIVYVKRKIAIFLHGCFWHSCPKCKLNVPKNNHEFWQDKLEKNKRRDEIVFDTLIKSGWRVVLIWECDLKNNPEREIEKVKKIF